MVCTNTRGVFLTLRNVGYALTFFSSIKNVNEWEFEKKPVSLACLKAIAQLQVVSKTDVVCTIISHTLGQMGHEALLGDAYSLFEYIEPIVTPHTMF